MLKRSSPGPLRIALTGALVAAQCALGLPGAAVAPAAAQVPPPRVWLSPLKADNVPGASLLSEKFDEATRKQLRRSERVQTTDQGQIGPVTAGESDPRVDQAERLRANARKSFMDGKHQEALSSFRAALDLYEEGLASIEKLEPVIETLGFIGAASLALGFDADAEDYFARVVALAPDAEPLDEYADDAKALFADVKKGLLKKKRGGLKIETTPPGATVRVDGVDRGAAPVTVTDLVRGTHYVQALHDEAGLAAAKARVKSGKPRPVALTLSTDVGPAPQKEVDAAVVAQMLSMARENEIAGAYREASEIVGAQTKADYVVVGVISPEGNQFVLRAYIYGLKEKQTAAFDPYLFRADLSSVFVQASQFAADIERAANDFPFDKVYVGQPVVVAPPPPPPEKEPPPPTPRELVQAEPEPEPVDISQAIEPGTPGEDDDDPWYGKWWVWTIVGVAVLGGAAYGGYVLLQDDAPANSFDATVRW